MREKFVVTLLLALLVGSLVVGGVVIFRPAPREEGGAGLLEFARSFPVGSRDVIGIVRLRGMITHQGGRFGGDPTARVIRRLHQLGEHPRVRAVIMQINSPGGSVAASQDIYDEVMRLRQKGIKVVASISDLGASGAYYVASACDYVIARPGALVGSVGVIMQFPDYTGLTEGLLKIKMNTIRSGEFKDIMSPFRHMRPEERAALQAIVDDAFDQFRSVVVEGRRRVQPDAAFDEAWQQKHLNGLVWTGRQAQTERLIEETGGFEEAKAAAKRLAGLGDNVDYATEPTGGLLQFLISMSARQGGLERLADSVGSAQHVRLEYMFRPGL